MSTFLFVKSAYREVEGAQRTDLFQNLISTGNIFPPPWNTPNPKIAFCEWIHVSKQISRLYSPVKKSLKKLHVSKKISRLFSPVKKSLKKKFMYPSKFQGSFFLLKSLWKKLHVSKQISRFFSPVKKSLEKILLQSQLAQSLQWTQQSHFYLAAFCGPWMWKIFQTHPLGRAGRWLDFEACKCFKMHRLAYLQLVQQSLTMKFHEVEEKEEKNEQWKGRWVGNSY